MKVLLAAIAAVILLAHPCDLSAQSFGAFGARPTAQFSPGGFTDADLDGMTAKLDRLLADAPAGPAGRETATDALWQFARRLQSGRLSPAQESRVLAHIDRVARARSEAPAVTAGPRRLIASLSVGKVAPEIIGKDLSGRPLKLSEFRRKVVLLVFTADWCAICRAQAPYERFLLDKYGSWPFAILAVETGSSREAARQSHATSPLSHRSWWDEPRTGETGGPIAAAWNVTGFPATYLVDGDGVIRFVDVREEAMLIAVRQLVEAEADRPLKPQQRTK